MSKEKELTLKICDRLAAIKIADGWLTDIGTTVFRGKMDLDVSELPCTVLANGDDNTIEQQNMQARLHLRFVAEGHMFCDQNNPTDAVLDMSEDLKKAIFGGDSSYDGIIRPSQNKTPGLRYIGRTIGTRESGSNAVSAGITFDCEIVENLNNP